MAQFTDYFWDMWDKVINELDTTVLAEELFDVRNEVLFDGFPEYRITGRMDPAHRAVYTALAQYVIDNFDRKS